MKSKLEIIIFILFINCLRAQTYQKDWSALNAKIESDIPISINEAEFFLLKYKNQLSQFPDNSTQLYSLLANNYYNDSKFEKAEENYLNSYKYSLLAADTTLKHIVELNLAYLNQNLNKLLEAEKYYAKCMSGMAAIYGQSSREYTGIFYDYTRLLIDIEKYKEAKPYVDALLFYYKTLDGENNTRYVGLLNCNAIIYQNTGNYKEAIDIYNNLINENKLLLLGDTLGHVIQLSNLGDVYREVGEYNLGISNLKNAKALYFKYKLRDRDILATIENNSALCYKNTSQFKLAEDCYNNSLEIRKANNETKTEPYCSTLSNKADLLRMLGRYGEASELLITALEIRRERYGDKTENYANALSNLANVYFDSGNFKEALEYNLKAKEIYQIVVGENHQSYGNSLNSLSICYLHNKNYDKAEEYKIQALNIIELSVGKNHYRYSAYLISSVGLYLKTRQLQKAEKNLKEALFLVERNLGRKHELFAQAQLSLAEVYSIQSRFEEATPLYFECLDYYSAQINSYFNSMSEENQMDYLQFISPAFESYNVYLINYKLSKPTKDFGEYLKRALRYQLQLKSMLANRSAQLKKEIENSNDADMKSIYQNWLSVKTELLNNYKSADAAIDNNELYKKASDLEAKLKSKLKNLISTTNTTFDLVKQNLNDDEAAIEIFKVNEIVNDSEGVIKYGMLVIKNKLTQPDFIIYKNGDELEDVQFKNYLRCIDEQVKDSLSYNAFIKPLEKSLKGIKRIYISSDGLFHKLSFLSLYNPESKKYLIDDYEIYQISNLGSISKNANDNLNKNLTASLFGYPDYDYDFKKAKSNNVVESKQLVAKRYGLTNLSKLPGTKTEVEKIAKNLNSKNWKTVSFTEQFASEENLRKVNSPKILHIATHGFYLKDIDNDDKLFLGFNNSTLKQNSLLRSGLILAGAGPSTADSLNINSENDGVLTAQEASFLNLSNTDIVVLSACQTGLGDEMGSEGVAGLQRSFTIAGAKNIIMSLWPVDDFATELLMTEFYKNYSETQNVELSFKQAQQIVKSRYPQPYYWAAFVLLKTFN
ncbi:MAG: CHAT domain-containing protein [Bacteroidota bacterium]|nr:CHAT domain-containing protein [Bacteroidota bacterium]MDP3144960.1 CHAT domain-containing protein [Bacteroidota bacterium]